MGLREIVQIQKLYIAVPADIGEVADYDPCYVEVCVLC